MSLLKDNNSNFNPEEAVKILLKTHFQDHLECPGPGQPELELVWECLDQGAVGLDPGTGDFFEYMDTEKVRNAMRSFGSRKAPAPDGFKPIVLKNLNEKAAVFLASLYKMSIRWTHEKKARATGTVSVRFSVLKMAGKFNYVIEGEDAGRSPFCIFEPLTALKCCFHSKYLIN